MGFWSISLIIDVAQVIPIPAIARLSRSTGCVKIRAGLQGSFAENEKNGSGIAIRG